MDRLFTGQRLDGTGLYYYGARYYEPGIGRFLSPDSIAPDLMNPQSLNRYSYVFNNPLKYNDPSGNWPPILDRHISRAKDVVGQSINAARQGLQVAESKVIETYNKAKDSVEQTALHSVGVKSIERVTYSDSSEPVRVWTASNSGINAVNNVLDVFDAESLTPGPDTILLRADSDEVTLKHEFAHIGQARELEQQSESYLGEYIDEYVAGAIWYWSFEEAYIYHPMEWGAREEAGQIQPDESPTPWWEDLWYWLLE